jgi:hypothetical protein
MWCVRCPCWLQARKLEKAAGNYKEELSRCKEELHSLRSIHDDLQTEHSTMCDRLAQAEQAKAAALEHASSAEKHLASLKGEKVLQFANKSRKYSNIAPRSLPSEHAGSRYSLWTADGCVFPFSVQEAVQQTLANVQNALDQLQQQYLTDVDLLMAELERYAPLDVQAQQVSREEAGLSHGPHPSAVAAGSGTSSRPSTARGSRGTAVLVQHTHHASETQAELPLPAEVHPLRYHTRYNTNDEVAGRGEVFEMPPDQQQQLYQPRFQQAQVPQQQQQHEAGRWWGSSDGSQRSGVESELSLLSEPGGWCAHILCMQQAWPNMCSQGFCQCYVLQWKMQSELHAVLNGCDTRGLLPV